MTDLADRLKNIPTFRLKQFANGKAIWGKDPAAFGSIKAMAEATGTTEAECWRSIQLAADIVRAREENDER